MATRESVRLRAEQLEQRLLLAADLSLSPLFHSTPDLSAVEFRSIDGTGSEAPPA